MPTSGIVALDSADIDADVIDVVDASSATALIKELEELCASNELSIETLREKIDQHIQIIILDDERKKTSFFHQACLNDNVTFEIIEYLLEYFPNAAEHWGVWLTEQDGYSFESEAYPLHCCAYNVHCSTKVIQLLIEKYPAAVETFSSMNELIPEQEDYIKGLPLHYYLSRQNNVDIDAVKMLVEAYPHALLLDSEDDYGYKPLHIAAYNPNAIHYLRDVLPYLLSVEPASIQVLDKYGETPLHVACYGDKNGGVEVVELLYNAWPQAMYSRDTCIGNLPIHCLCGNGQMDENTSLSILRFMLNVGPDLPMYSADNSLPIHCAVRAKSSNFCKELIDACPETLWDASLNSSHLPIHEACGQNRIDTLDTVKYMLEVYPESIHARVWQSIHGMIFGGDGYLPIHFAAEGESTEVLEFLLMRDPGAVSSKVLYPPFPVPESLDSKHCEWALPLHIAAYRGKMKQIEMLYDAYPEAILAGNKLGDTPLDLARKCTCAYMKSPTAEKFLETQLGYARIAQDPSAMATVDETGQLPLHHALKDNASLGTIQLMVRGNSSVFVTDQMSAFPLHIACEFSSLKVVKFLVELSGKTMSSSGAPGNIHECACCGKGESSSNRLKLCTACKMAKYCNVTCQKAHRSQHRKECKKQRNLIMMKSALVSAADLQIESLFNLLGPKVDCDVCNHCDANKDSILHYACRGGNLALVKYLLENHAPLVASTTVNAIGELPIHLLCQAGKEDKVDKESTGYIETIWLLLLANPELPFSASYIRDVESFDHELEEVKGERLGDAVNEEEEEEVEEEEQKKKSWRKKLSPFRLFSRKAAVA